MYNIADWYWRVTGNTTQVYSSARKRYIPITDTTYHNWIANGGCPTNISASDLATVINPMIEDEIQAIEATTLRPLRDIAAGNGNVVTNGKTPLQRLADAESQIATLRTHLLS